MRFTILRCPDVNLGMSFKGFGGDLSAPFSIASKRSFASFFEYFSESFAMAETSTGLWGAIMGGAGDDWYFRHYPNHRDHMQALGVIAANYNDLEGAFYRLFFIIMHNVNVGKLVFAKLNNAERMSVARKAAEIEPAVFRPLFEYFIAGFGVATENRNILMHSKAHNAGALASLGQSHLTFAKSTKADMDENNFVSLEVQELRDIADDMANFSVFGFDLFLWRVALITKGTITWGDGKTTTPTLPEKPREPRKLTLSAQEAQITVSPPQQSSAE